MELIVFIVMLFTSFGRLEMVEVKGPFLESQVCMQERENFMNGDPERLALVSYKRVVTPCFQIQAHNLPRCE